MLLSLTGGEVPTRGGERNLRRWWCRSSCSLWPAASTIAGRPLSHSYLRPPPPRCSVSLSLRQAATGVLPRARTRDRASPGHR